MRAISMRVSRDPSMALTTMPSGSFSAMPRTSSPAACHPLPPGTRRYLIQATASTTARALAPSAVAADTWRMLWRRRRPLAGLSDSGPGHERPPTEDRQDHGRCWHRGSPCLPQGPSPRLRHRGRPHQHAASHHRCGPRGRGTRFSGQNVSSRGGIRWIRYQRVFRNGL